MTSVLSGDKNFDPKRPEPEHKRTLAIRQVRLLF